tara:strand:- start:53 stop:1948 length:1896 start_codon:yes stop_codon:yes gene_type:complete
MLVGILGNLAKKSLSKPKTPKVQSPKDVGGKDAAKTKPKGQLVPSPGGAIVKIISVPAPVKKDVLVGDDPALMQMQAINNRTFDILKALKADQKAKKKKATAKKNLFSWFQRKGREEDREAKSGKALTIPGMGKISGGIGNLFGNILKVLALLFAGWLTNYLPQIIKAVRAFIDIVGKIINFVKPIAQLFLDIGKWIVGAGTKLAARLVGVDPKIAEENSIIQNLNEIQKRFPLLEAAFASFLVFKGLGGIKTLMKPGGKPGGKPGVTPKTPKVRGTSTNIKTASRASKLVNKTHGPAAQRIYDNAIKNGKSVAGANAEVQRALRRGQIVSKPDFGLSSKGKPAGKIFKGGPLRSVKRAGIRALGRGKSLGLARFGTKVAKLAKLPIIGGLIVAVTQMLAGEPVGKALFMGVGAGIGGILGGLIGSAGGPLAVVGAIMGEMIGTFVGELLYEGFMGKGWGAAGEKLKQAMVGIWDNMIKPLGKWIKGVFGRFINKFKEENKLPKYLGGGTNWLKIINPFVTTPLLWKALFGKDEKQEEIKRDDLKSDSKSESTAIKPGTTSSQKTKDADAIGESASYDQQIGGTDTVIVNSGGGAVSGGGGRPIPNIIGGDDFYKAALLNRKKSNLAKVWA